MNYQKIYDSLIERGLNRPHPECYVERHHIIPRCMGGVDENNIVILTAREHFIAHQLLCKIHPDNIGLSYAAMKMSSCSRWGLNSKMYEWLKVRHSLNTTRKLKNTKLYYNPEHNKRIRLNENDIVPEGYISGIGRKAKWTLSTSRSDFVKSQWEEKHDLIAINAGFKSLNDFVERLLIERLTTPQKTLCDKYNISKTTLRRIYINSGNSPSDREFRRK